MYLDISEQILSTERTEFDSLLPRPNNMKILNEVVRIKSPFENGKTDLQFKMQI